MNCHLVAFNGVVLKDIFRVRLNDLIRPWLPGGKIHWSLEQYIDHALLLSGSSFTVGIADEEHSYPTVPTTPSSCGCRAWARTNETYCQCDGPTTEVSVSSWHQAWRVSLCLLCCP